MEEGIGSRKEDEEKGERKMGRGRRQRNPGKRE